MRYRNLPTITRFPVLSASILDDFFDEKLELSSIGVDMYEEEDSIIVETQAPGFTEENLEVDIDNRILTIRGNVKSETKDEKKNYYLREMRQESFQRSVQLPAQIDEDSVEAQYKDGIVTVRLQKKVESGKKKIELKRG